MHGLAPASAAIEADDARISRVAHAFAEVVDAKAPSTGGHSHRVAALVAGAADSLGLGGEREVVRAALLHDIGKLGLSNRILDKPGPLTSKEWTAVRAHPLQTEAVLHRAAALRPIAAIAGAHHERLDGSGYPRGLTAEELPLAARLVTVADVYDSMVSSRPYRVALTPSGAIDRMRDEARAGRLDADCVDALAAFALAPGREHGAPTVGAPSARGEHPAHGRRHVEAVHARLGRGHVGGGALLPDHGAHGLHDRGIQPHAGGALQVRERLHVRGAGSRRR